MKRLIQFVSDNKKTIAITVLVMAIAYWYFFVYNRETRKAVMRAVGNTDESEELKPLPKNEFTLKYYKIAKKALDGSGIHPRTAITQAVLESSDDGLVANSNIALKAGNPFGIKGTYNGMYYQSTAVEWDAAKNTYVNVGATKWAKYPTAYDAFLGYRKFLSTNRYEKVRKATTPLQQFAELKAAGYATEPTYVKRLTDTYNSLIPYFEQAERNA